MTIVEEILSNLTLSDLASLVGGCIGSCMVSDRKRYGWKLAVLTIIASTIIAGAAGDWAEDNYHIVSLWIRTGFGLVVGLFAGTLLDQLRLYLPNLSKKLVVGGGDIVVNNGIDMINRVTGHKDTPPPPETPTDNLTNDSPK